MSLPPDNSVNANSPRFSVIIPCWNAGTTLRQTLEFLTAQDFENWEAIIVDDGSQDNTAAIISEYCAKDTRFQTISTSRGGPSAARNLAAMQLARGEFLAFLDSDDLWMPAKLSSSLAYLENHKNVDAVYAQISFFRTSHLKPETYSTVYSSALNPIDFLRDNPVCTTSNLVMRRDVFCQHNGFDQSIVHNEDVEFLIRCSASGARIEGIDQHHVCYRTNVTGLSSDLNLMRKGWYKAVTSLQATPFRLTEKQIAAADAGNLRYLARRALRTGAPGFEALRFAAIGLMRSPTSFFSPLWRGTMTLLGALIAPFLPKTLRTLAFSR